MATNIIQIGQNGRLNQDITSIEGDERSQPPLYDYELCTKDPSLSFTHHIVGVQILNLGATAERTDEGIIDRNTKQLLADTDGISVNMRFKEDII